MILRINLLLISLILYFKVEAQQVLQVNIVNKDSALIAATLSLYSLPDSVLIQQKVAIKNKVIFNVKEFSKYLVKVSCIGFNMNEKTISIINKPITINFFLTAITKNLATVIVQSKKPIIKQEDDKTIIDAENLANSSTNAYEVLEKTPGAIVDQDGNVYLNSAAPATIYINGRELKMSTEDVAALLKSLPAGSISKIEILRTPSAKYDATNSGGIVNIVLKKGIKIGTAGSVNVRYDQGVYATQSLGASLNKNFGKTNTYFTYQFTHKNSYEDIQSNRFFNVDTLLNQYSNTKYSPNNNYLGGGLDYDVNKKLNFAFDSRITYTNNYSKTSNSNDFIKNSNQNIFSSSNSPGSHSGDNFYISHSISSKLKLDTTGSEWTSELSYTYTKNSDHHLYSNQFILPFLPTNNFDGNTNTSANLYDFKTDLLLKTKHKLSLETGIKYINNSNKNEAIYYSQVSSNAQTLDTYQTNSFKYAETISSFYVQASKPFWGFTLKVGARLENTNIKGQQLIPTNQMFHINRNDLFPFVYIKHNLLKIFGYPLTGNLVYKKSITRPNYDALNPSPKLIDQYLYSIGNVNLKPQFTTNYELNVSYNEFPVLAFGINDTKDIFSNVTYQNSVTKITYKTYDNLGKNKEYYARFFGALPGGGASTYFAYIGVQYNFQNYNGYYQNLPLKYTIGSWTFFTGHNYKATPTLSFYLNAWLYVNGFRQFAQLKNMGQLNISITKKLLKNKLSVILSGNDILATNKAYFTINHGNTFGNGSKLQDNRKIGLTLRYNFGFTAKDENKKKKTEDIQPIEN